MNEERRHHFRRFNDRSRTVAATLEDPPRSRVSWGALFAGVVVAMATQILLGALGLAVGLTAADQADSFGVGAGVWWLISGILALFLGGWTASRLANKPRRVDGGLHGFATWGLATIVSAWMLTSAVGGILGGAWSAVTTAATATATTAAARPDLADRAGDMLRQAGVDPSQAEAFAERLRSDAAATPEAQREARQAAEQARDAASTASWFLFGMLLLGAAAATFGGLRGTPDVVDELDVRSHVDRSAAAAG
jgi:hypothetical protein